MTDKKKGIDEIFEEEFFDLPAKKGKTTQKKKDVEDLQDIFEDFAPQPVDEMKKKKKIAEDLLEDFLAPPKKPPVEKEEPGKRIPKPKVQEPQESKAPSQVKEQISTEGVVDDFIISPPKEQKPTTPPQPVKRQEKREPVEKKPQVVAPVEVPRRGFLPPFLMGLASGVVITGAVAVALFFISGKKPTILKQTKVSSTVSVNEKKVSKPEKVASVASQPTAAPQPSQPSPSSISAKPEVSKPSPPPPPITFTITVSNIKGDSGLRRVRRVLARYRVKEASVSSRVVATELYQVYIDKIFSPAEANAAELKFGIMGFKYNKKNEAGGIRYYFGPFKSPTDASGMIQKLTQINYPAKIRVDRSTVKYYTLTTNPVSKDTANRLKRKLRGYRVTLKKSS